jgi:branched-subunit amino acid aminotransferase/4-amino-4-deoxychorismate lyase
MKMISLDQFREHAGTLRKPFHEHYYAMYSSVYDAVVTDPVLMMVPVDDHVVHRGDGVFEAFKSVDGCIYNLDAHLNRLECSAAAVCLPLPHARDELRRVIMETVRCGGRPDCLVRVILSRGSGSYGVNPYDCPVPHVYVTVSRLAPPFMAAHPEGARVKSSNVPVKHAFMAVIKNCNYLYNALMKKEAVDAGVDFTLAFDADNCMAEGATENMGIVSQAGDLCFPRLDRILAGTTMLRVAELAGTLVEKQILRSVQFRNIPRQELDSMREMVVVGTTFDVAAVVQFDGRPVGGGTPGPIAAGLLAALQKDIRENRRMQTPVFE